MFKSFIYLFFNENALNCCITSYITPRYTQTSFVFSTGWQQLFILKEFMSEVRI